MNNCFTFFRRNKKKSSIMFVIMILSVFCISFVFSTINSVYDTAKNATVTPFERFSILVTENDAMLNSATRKIIDSSDSFQSVITATSIKTILGTTSSYVVFPADFGDIALILERLQITISVGRLPEKDSDEIVVHSNIMKNKNVELGNKIGDYTVVGMFDGNIELCIGAMKKEKIDGYFLNKTSYIILPSSIEKLSEYNLILNEIDEAKIDLYTYEKRLQSINDEFASIKTILYVIVVLVSLCIVIAITALFYIMYSGRYEEFAILNAIGHKKREIRSMILGEMLYITVASWLLGLILSWSASYLVEQLIYSSMGQTMKIYNLDALFLSSIIPVLVVFCSVYSTNRKLTKTDLISIIERR